MDYKKWLDTNIGDVSNKTYIVTGATGTLGGMITRNLLSQNASVIMGIRNSKKAQLLIAELEKDFPTASVRAYPLNLTSFTSIECFCEQLTSEYTHIDGLINNAGIYHLPKITAEGYDIHYMVNYLAPLKLTELLQPLTKNGKVAFVTSISQKGVSINQNDIQSQNTNNKITIYARSKLLLSDGVLSMGEMYPEQSFALCHPGIFSSELFSEKDGRYSKSFSFVIKCFMKAVFNTPQKSSLNVLYAVTHDIPKGHWVCPRILGIWGIPKVQKMKTRKAM